MEEITFPILADDARGGMWFPMSHQLDRLVAYKDSSSMQQHGHIGECRLNSLRQADEEGTGQSKHSSQPTPLFSRA